MNPGVLVVHGIVVVYQALMAIFAIAALNGVQIMNSTGWLAFFLVAYLLLVIETSVAAVLGTGGEAKKPNGILSRSVTLAIWHWFLDIFTGVLVLTFFLGYSSGILGLLGTWPKEGLSGQSLLALSTAQSHWNSTMALLIAGWFAELVAVFSLLVA